MGLEQFRPRKSPESGEPMISLRKSGSFGINQPAIEEMFDDAESVALYYDEEENLVGFEPRDSDDDDAYVLTDAESGGSITAMAFVNRYGLQPELTTRFIPEEDDELVVIDLDEPAGTYGTPETDEENEETE
jgi:hypothetical protein